MNDDSREDRVFTALFADVRRALSPTAGLRESVREQVFTEMREAAQDPPPSGRNRHRGRPRRGLTVALRRIVQPALLAAAIAGCIVLAAVLSVGSATPTWAQVAERFAAVKTFNAKVYYRQNALSEVVAAELWVGVGGRVRVTGGHQVLFGEKGKETRAFDVKERKETSEKKTSIAARLVNTFRGRETFSLDVVAEFLSGGALKDVTPQLSGEASVAEDLVVYDMRSPHTPKWCRIWALHKSRLPVQIVIWDPRDGGRVDVVLTYGPEPSPKFFDADVFARRLADRSISDRTLPYVDLVDAGGKNFVPSPLQVPKAVDLATPTLDGKPWSLKDRAGKVTLLHVWDPRNSSQGIMLDRRYLMPLYEAYGKRDDFQIVTLVIFEDVKRVRKMKASEQAPWLFLCDGKGWDGELVRALGGPQFTSFYLVDRQGHIRDIRDVADPRVIEVELVGPTYDNYSQLRVRFDDEVRAGRLTAETVRTIFGEPDERAKSPRGPHHERWVYVRRSKSEDQERRVFVDVDLKKGLVTGFSQSHRILQPARRSR